MGRWWCKGDRIAAVGPAAEVLTGFSGLICDHGHGAILPGVVNCHVHLEFSALAGQVPPQARWEDWLEATLAAYGALAPDRGGGRASSAALTPCGKAARPGGGGHQHRGFLAAPGHSPLPYHLFYECLGFDLLETFDLPERFPWFGRPEVADAPWVSAAAHAPYSVSAALFRAVDAWNAARLGPQMVHLAESQAEIDFLARGNGFFEGLLKRRGRWVPDFPAPGVSPPAYLDRLEFLGPRTLTVHGTQLGAADCDLLAGTGTWLVLCPRANRYTGAGVPPVPELLTAGVNLALGTDSLAGNWDLNLFGEMLWLHAELSRLARGPLAAPGDPERRPGPGPGPGLRESDAREKGGPGVHSPDGPPGFLGRTL